MNDFKGREKEMALLRKSNWREKAQLIALYGRRRVGKTALVEKSFEKDRLWKFEGLEGLSTRKQIQHFFFSLYQYTQNEAYRTTKADVTWEEAFIQLDKEIGKEPCVVFFDEFQWMASMRGSMVSVFKWAWDNYFSKRRQCRFILCGSVSSFIVRKVVKSKALYGRVDLEMHLEPFSVSETWSFFDGQRTREEALDIHLTLGGVPQYLRELNPKLSLLQNLEQMAFSSLGYFFREYQRLFISHFSKNAHYETILRTLSKKGPLPTEALATALQIPGGGTLSLLLEDLALAGFIEKYTPVDKPERSRLIQYRIEDEFLNFYFQFIEPNRKAIQSDSLKAFEVLSGPAFDQWRGYAFEGLCRKHHTAIAKTLGFSGIRYRAGSWFRTSGDEKTQVDLLFDRADRVVTVCEIKYGDRLSGSEIINRFERRLAILKRVYPQRIQKVLLLARSPAIPERLKQYFDEILTAEKLFY